ncbi:MAG: glycosyltransferase family 2 protein [Ignavibacteriaceae bacterium]|nr:glycosyltransferase family 2 protein [Ignavibacteriaceae bacterium]
MEHNNNNATAIMCAYNEKQTIGGILETLLKCIELDKIIVVNDGSTDGTSIVLEKFIGLTKLRIIELPENKGKGFAMAEGIANAQNNLLVFVDADLTNFKVEYIQQLIQPLLEGKANMVIGQPTENVIDYHLNPFIPLAGERALFRKDVYSLIEQIRETRFGVETLINLHYKANNMKTLYVSLWGLTHPTKMHKYPFTTSVREYFLAAKQITKTMAVNYMLVVLTIRNIFLR